MNDKLNQLTIAEHDKTFKVKKVGLFVDNEDGMLVRQTKIATASNQVTIIGYIDGLESLSSDIKSNQTNGEQKTKLTDEYGNEVEATMTNQLKVAELTRLAGGVFNVANNGDVPDATFYSVVNSNATATVTNSELNIATTTTSGSSSQLTTLNVARYMGANSNMYRSVIRMSAGAANNVRRWGISTGNNPTDGFFFRLNNTGFEISSKTANGDEVIVTSGNFNGNGSSAGGTYVLDTNYHTYEIYFTNKRIMFVIDSNPIHTITLTNAVICATRHLRPYISNINTGVGSVTNIYCLVHTISRYGKPSSQPKSYWQSGTTTGVLLKIGPGSIHALNISAVLNNSNITLYNGISSSGTVLYSTGAMPANSVPFSVPMDQDGGTQFDAGLFLVISGANCNCQIRFE